MRTFLDDDGTLWRAAIGESDGGDYKGRYYLTVQPESGDEPVLELPEIRWNSVHTAERTLRTMSDVELRRRLRSAVGRVSARGPE